MDEIKNQRLNPVATSIINPNLKRSELKSKAADMVVGLDSSNIEEFNPQSSKGNRLLNKFYNRYQHKFKKNKFINTSISEVLKWDPKKQEQWFAAKKNQSAGPILGGMAAVGSLPWTLTGAVTAFKGASALYSQLPNWLKTTIDIGLTADGIRNAFSDNGIQKTAREVQNGNYGKAILSGIGDAADIIGGANLFNKSIKYAKKLPLNIHNNIVSTILPAQVSNSVTTNKALRESWLEDVRRWAKQINDQPPHTFSKKHPIAQDDRSKIKLSTEELEVVEDLPVPTKWTKYFENIPHQIAKRGKYNVSTVVENIPRMGMYNSNNNGKIALGYYFPSTSLSRDLSGYVFLNKNYFNKSTLTHELDHFYVDKNNLLPKQLTKEHTKALTEAYPVISYNIRPSEAIVERRAVNEQLREAFVDEFYKQYQRYPEINLDKNELMDFLENMTDDQFQEIIKQPTLRSQYLDDYLAGIQDIKDRELIEQSFWKSVNAPDKPYQSWISKMKYAIGNIPVITGFGLYNDYYNERNNNRNSR